MRRSDAVLDDPVGHPSKPGIDVGFGRRFAAEAGESASKTAKAGGALVLHDDEATVGLVRSVVESAGFEAIRAASAFEVAAAGVTSTTQLVVLGMTAVDDRDLEIVSLLRRRRPEAWFLVLFPSSLRERAARALALGADASLPEPFYPSELTALAARAVARTFVPAPTAPPAPAPPAPEVAAAPAPAPVAPPVPTAAAVPAPAKTEIVENLAAGVAHSIRNPLQILELQLAAAESDGDVDVPAMRRELRRIAGVVEGMTRYAGRQGPALKPTDLASLVTGVFVSRDVGAAGAEISVRLGEARVEVAAAPELLRAGFESLRNRAVRVTPPEGKISVRTRMRTDDGRRMVEISVTDGGPALTDDQRARLFDPFPDDASIQDGTGLDLAALAGIVREHDGAVLALSAGAIGTILVVRLPVREKSK